MTKRGVADGPEQDEEEAEQDEEEAEADDYIEAVWSLNPVERITLLSVLGVVWLLAELLAECTPPCLCGVFGTLVPLVFTPLLRGGLLCGVLFAGDRMASDTARRRILAAEPGEPC